MVVWFIYRIESGFIQQITMSSAPGLPKFTDEDAGLAAEYAPAYNEHLCGRYYDATTGNFYEDANFSKLIESPSTFAPEQE